MMHRIFVLFLFLAFACQEQTGNVKQNIPDLQRQSKNKKVVKFGVIARYSPRLIYQGYQPIMDYLTSETPFQFQLKLSKTYDEALNFLRRDSVQIASLGTYSYVEAHDSFGAQCILKPLNAQGNPSFQGIIIVRNDSPIHNLFDLKGKKIAFAAQKATAGYLIAKHALHSAGLALSDLEYFTNIEHHNAIVNAVLRGEYDAGAVKDVIAYKNEHKGLRFIYISDPIPSVPIAVGAHTDSLLVQEVKRALLKLDPNNPDHRNMMQNWDTEFKNGFVPASDEDYYPIRDLIDIVAKEEKGAE
ncbi:MAG: phosphate/phosphite/phosphonate ABC transporter substrate-binding protein [Deferribacteres bacterium]|nr:phosphate/phosphite/phosphonate ABC transporter substrate-binding protein [candidate division KSB1 bacterium]MCB9503990.1 phosphate/phosphite/phosphonate ABC transporter substrate-binding protein [Deferribacteres bacterium]